MGKWLNFSFPQENMRIFVPSWKWTTWSEWSPCSKSCIWQDGDVGTKRRQRNCIPPLNGGEDCSREGFNETVSCAGDGPSTSYCPIDGYWEDCTTNLKWSFLELHDACVVDTCALREDQDGQLLWILDMLLQSSEHCLSVLGLSSLKPNLCWGSWQRCLKVSKKTSMLLTSLGEIKSIKLIMF